MASLHLAVAFLSGRAVSCCAVSFFTYPPTPEIYTLSLHDALPIFGGVPVDRTVRQNIVQQAVDRFAAVDRVQLRSEEHTSELQSLRHLVCRLLLEKKKHASSRPLIVTLSWPPAY